MPSDINTYSLSVEFALMDMASPILDTVGEKLTHIEDQISNIAAHSMTQFSQVATEIQTSLTGIASQYDKINAISTTMLTPLRSGQAIIADMQKKLIDETSLLHDKMLVNWNDIVKTLTLKEKGIDSETAKLRTEQGLVGGIGRDFSTWGDHINRSSGAIRFFIEDLVNVNRHIVAGIEASERFHRANLRIYGTQSQMAQQAQTLAVENGLFREEVLGAYLELADVKVPLDSLNRLTVATAQLSRLSGVSTKGIADWSKSLMASGMQVAEVERRAGQLAVSMRRFGLSMADANALISDQTANMTRVMNEFGEFGHVLMNSQEFTVRFARSLNATEDQIRTMSQAWTRLTAVEWLRVEAQAASMNLNNDINTAAGQQEFLARAAISLARERIAIQNSQMSESQRLIEINALNEAQEGKYGRAMSQSIITAATLTQANLNRGRTEQEIMRLAVTAAQTEGAAVGLLAQIYQESNNSLQAQLRLTQSAFQAFFGALFNIVEPGLVAVMRGINSVVVVLGDLLKWINTALNTLGPAGTTIRIVAGIVLAAAAAFFVFNVALTFFGGLAGVVRSAGMAMGATIQYTLQGLARGLASLANYIPVMLSLAVLIASVGASAYLLAMAVVMVAEQGAAGQNALIGLTIAILALGIGLAIVGGLASAAWPGLLALAAMLFAAGAAALMFAAATWIIAQAAATLAETGWMGVAALIALAAVTVGAVAIFVALAPAAALAATGLGVLVLVMLGLGVASVLVGVGIWLLAQSISVIAREGSDGVTALIALTSAVVGLAIGLAVAGWIAAAAIPGLIALSAVLITFAVAAIGVGIAVLLLGAGFALVGAGAWLFAQAVGAIAQYGTEGVVAIVLLTAAIVGLAFGLAAAGGIALAASPGLIVLTGVLWSMAAVALAVGVGIALIGVGLMLAGVGAWLLAQAVAIIAEQGWAGALALGALALALVAFAVVAAIAGPLAALALIGFAIALGIIAVSLLIISVAAVVLAGAFWILAQAVDQLDFMAGVKLIVFALFLAAAAVVLAFVSSAIIVAASVFLVAAIALLVGAVLFIVSAALFDAGAPMFSSAMSSLGESAGTLPTIAEQIIEGAGVLLVAGGLLAIAGAAVALGAGALWLASWATERGFGAMVQSGELAGQVGAGFLLGGRGLYDGGQLMQAAIGIITSAATALDGVGSSIQENLTALRDAAGIGAQAGLLLLVAGVGLRSGVNGLMGASVQLTVAAAFLSVPAAALTTTSANLASALNNLRLALAIRFDDATIVFANQIAVVADSMRSIVASLGSLHSNADGLVTAVDDIRSIVSALSGLRSGTDELIGVSTQLTIIADDMRSIVTALESLHSGVVSLLAAADDMRSIVTALESLHSGVGSLLAAADDMHSIVSAIGELRLGANELTGVAAQLAVAAVLFSAPAAVVAAASSGLASALRDLRTVLMVPLDDVMVTFADELLAAADGMYSSLDSITATLEGYARRMEGAAARIASSFRRAMPSTPLAIFGLNVVRPDPIATTQPRDHAAINRANEDRDQQTRAQRAQAETLASVRDIMNDIKTTLLTMSGAGAGPLNDIKRLLETHLPEIASGNKQSLQSPMNDWMR